MPAPHPQTPRTDPPRPTVHGTNVSVPHKPPIFQRKVCDNVRFQTLHQEEGEQEINSVFSCRRSWKTLIHLRNSTMQCDYR
ncbi:hypothetical protein J6590_083400 [Homalodisca vitripennis]|nr:hypothetical protein J6590_083400 [Homalodisca vitripennis]